MAQRRDVPFSVLDLAPIVEGGDAADALRRSRELAQHAERYGYRRYWFAEHHNMPGVASAATAVVIGYVAEATSRLRVGAGGVMLPNHAPLVIAEQFGTLAALYPDRIDLGLGRAPGADQLTARALRRDPMAAAESFPGDVSELLDYFRDPPGQRVRAVPGAGLHVPVWLLGSSLYSAQLAARLGLPFAFAAHFAPDLLMAALESYRARFRPSEQLDAPYAMVCTNVFVADTDAEARRSFTSLEQAFVALRQGRPGPLPPPIDPAVSGTALAQSGLAQTFRYAIVGGPAKVRAELEQLLESTRADELMATTHMFDHQARLRSFELLAGVRDSR